MQLNDLTPQLLDDLIYVRVFGSLLPTPLEICFFTDPQVTKDRVNRMPRSLQIGRLLEEGKNALHRMFARGQLTVSSLIVVTDVHITTSLRSLVHLLVGHSLTRGIECLGPIEQNLHTSEGVQERVFVEKRLYLLIELGLDVCRRF